MIGSLIPTVLISLWLILPAYFANSSPVIFGGGKPIDHGLTIHGKRLFGDGKTYRGTVAGVCCGILAGLLQNYIGASINAPIFPLSVLILLSTGALFGDLLESLIKRRLGIEQGSFFFPFDQLDFILGAYLFLWLFAHAWFLQHFTPTVIVILLIITPLLHILSNAISYLAGKKDVPW